MLPHNCANGAKSSCARRVKVARTKQGVVPGVGSHLAISVNPVSSDSYPPKWRRIVFEASRRLEEARNVSVCNKQIIAVGSCSANRSNFVTRTRDCHAPSTGPNSVPDEDDLIPQTGNTFQQALAKGRILIGYLCDETSLG